jgi:hypothetical protein
VQENANAAATTDDNQEINQRALFMMFTYSN